MVAENVIYFYYNRKRIRKVFFSTIIGLPASFKKERDQIFLSKEKYKVPWVCALFFKGVAMSSEWWREGKTPKGDQW